MTKNEIVSVGRVSPKALVALILRSYGPRAISVSDDGRSTGVAKYTCIYHSSRSRARHRNSCRDAKLRGRIGPDIRTRTVTVRAARRSGKQPKPVRPRFVPPDRVHPSTFNVYLAMKTMIAVNASAILNSCRRRRIPVDPYGRIHATGVHGCSQNVFENMRRKHVPYRRLKENTEPR